MSVTRLRLLQLVGILLNLACMALVYWRHISDEVPITVRHWIVIVLAIWAAISGFTIQHRIVHGRPRPSGKSSPFRRWKLGNMIRLWAHSSVGMWGLVLSDWGGPHLIVNGLLAIGLVLLLFWSPGVVPAESDINS